VSLLVIYTEPSARAACIYRVVRTPDSKEREPEDVLPGEGLYRTTVAGPGRSLKDAFERLRSGAPAENWSRHATEDSSTTRVELSPSEGEGYWELTQIREDYYVVLSNFKYKTARFEFVPGDGLVQFNFKVSGDLTYGVRLPGPLRFNRPALHLWRQPVGVDMREWTAPSAMERMVTVVMEPEYLRRHFLAGVKELPARLESFMTNTRRSIDYCELPLTAQMLDLTVKLLNNPFEGALYVRYKEAVVQQLLCSAIGLCALPAASAHTYNERQLKALRTARTMLVERLSSPPTTRDIARSVGLPQKTLTAAFRTIYGETVYDFGLRCRMQHALKLLRDDGVTVDDTSSEVGYAHPTSFATAFFKYFGMRPREVKAAHR
jgi:AraC-like DNA-binding protein